MIALDGPDGVGKTTQLKLLSEYLQNKGYRTHTARQSGGTPIGEELRRVSLSLVPRSGQTDLYISLAMAQALAEDIAKRKKDGEVILIDRSPITFVAYNGYGSQITDKDTVFNACEQAYKAEQIDLLLFFDAPQAILDSRRQKRGTIEYFEKQGAAYHQRVRQGYKAGLNFLQKHSDLGSSVIKIDASRDINSVHKSVSELIEL